MRRFIAACLLATAGTALAADNHVFDRAGVLSPGHVARLDQYMAWIQRESDVDVRFVFVRGLKGKSIEEAAADTAAQLRLGGKTGGQRGVLLLFDTEGRKLKIEVGYGLEGYFPDAFVSYLVHDHARAFFATEDLSLGLRLLLRLLQNRIREAVLGMDFDPRPLKVFAATHLTGGAGVTAQVRRGDRGGMKPTVRIPEAERSRYRARASPEETYAAYMDWMTRPDYDPDVDFFTPESRRYLARLPMSHAYHQFIYMGEFGKAHKFVQREALALQVFTGTPFVSPHFFVKEDGVWRIDMVAEVRNTKERVGGAYTWSYSGKDDAHSRAFADLVTMLQGYERLSIGDNRALPIRGDRR